MKRMHVLAIFVVLLAGMPVLAQTAGMLSFQGVLKDANGNLIDGPVELEFRIFDAETGGNLVDMDGDGTVEDMLGEDAIQLTTDVLNGVVSTSLGPVSPSAFDGNPRFLEVRTNGVALSRVRMDTAPATAEQVNIPGTGTPAIRVTGYVAPGDETAPPTPQVRVEGYKPYLINHPIASDTGGFGDPSDFYLLLHRAYDGGCASPGDAGCLDRHYVFGTITARRGTRWAWNRTAVVHINSASGYDSNRAQVSSVFENWYPVSLRHQGVRYLALRPPVGSVLYGLEFTGWAYVPEGEPTFVLVSPGAVNEVAGVGQEDHFVDGNFVVNGNIINKGFSLVHEGADFLMRFAPRGDGGRALVHSDGDTLVINFGGDFAGGVQVHSGLRVEGTSSARTVQITGADVAERFPVSESVEPGMVVVMDPEQPGRMKLARTAYDHRVAGVVSGAGGLSAGVILANLPGTEDSPPVAMSGRVYVWADASFSPIDVGDMLTTSHTRGHAMRASDPSRSFGAVIGKAMEPLAEGRGLILVLVNLQ